MTDAPGDTIFFLGEPRVITQRFLATRPVAETVEQRRLRRKLRLPERTFAYTILTTKAVP